MELGNHHHNLILNYLRRSLKIYISFFHVLRGSSIFWIFALKKH